MGVFRFKKFEVINERSAMKVGTDGVILGAAVTLPVTEKAAAATRVLDAGTGTGVVALMIAQRCENAMVIGIDIDAGAAAEASMNFSNSPWKDRLEARLQSLQETEEQFDLIVSNPPYFDSSLENPDPGKTLARHTGTMSYRTLIDYAVEHLDEEGSLSMILPSDRERDLLRYARMNGFYPARILRIRTVPHKEPMRFVVELRQGRRKMEEEEIVIQEKGRYTERYTDLVRDFYLWA